MQPVDQDTMRELHTRITKAVAKSIAEGVPPTEAMERHIRALELLWPKVATEYRKWILTQ